MLEVVQRTQVEGTGPAVSSNIELSFTTSAGPVPDTAINLSRLFSESFRNSGKRRQYGRS